MKPDASCYFLPFYVLGGISTDFYILLYYLKTLIKLVLKSFSYHSINFRIVVSLLCCYLFFHSGCMPDVGDF